MKQGLFLLLVLLQMTVAISVFGQEKAKMVDGSEVSVTKHTLQLKDGTKIDFTATTGYMPLTTEYGEVRANIFFTAYTKDNVSDVAARPITYTFNGGPGSSSVWLHMGALGPKRIVMTEKGDATKPPYQVVDNEYAWLAFTDLVFIDPVMTGYSRPAKEVDKKEFLGYVEDLESVGAFIHKYSSKFERWASPKYLAGESYGTTRAAGLSDFLQERYGMYLNGLVLISHITNFQTARFEIGNDLPYPLFLPTYVATAWYHGKLAKEFTNLEVLLREVENFAMNEYTIALMKGDQLTETERKSVAQKLARYTGLSETYILQTNLRVVIQRFTKELRRSEGLTVGRLDSRFTAKDYDSAGENYEFDPSYDGVIYGPYTRAIYDHLQRNLKYKNDLPYEILTGRARPWNYNNVQNQYLNVSESLRSAIHKNPSMKVLICNGYYDLATPYFATKYTIDHMFLDTTLKPNIEMTFYEAGHMMYIHKPSLVKMYDDVKRFYGK